MGKLNTLSSNCQTRGNIMKYLVCWEGFRHKALAVMGKYFHHRRCLSVLLSTETALLGRRALRGETMPIWCGHVFQSSQDGPYLYMFPSFVNWTPFHSQITCSSYLYPRKCFMCAEKPPYILIEIITQRFHNHMFFREEDSSSPYSLGTHSSRCSRLGLLITS